MRNAPILFLFAFLCSGRATAAMLWAIGSDTETFVPNQLTIADTSAQSVATVAALGDGSLGFIGGLTFGPGGVLYGIANDSSGAGSLFQIDQDGVLTLIGSAGGLGFGFYGGLAFDSQDGMFYAAVNDSNGDTSLYSITTGGVSTALSKALGTGFTGLTFDSANGLFYGIGNDENGFSRLYNFSLGGQVLGVAALGFGFGGLTYDFNADAFWAISPVSNIGGQVFQIDASGNMSGPVMTLGDGFFELAAPTPEGGTLVATGSGLLILATTMKLFRRKK